MEQHDLTEQRNNLAITKTLHLTEIICPIKKQHLRMAAEHQAEVKIKEHRQEEVHTHDHHIQNHQLQPHHVKVIHQVIRVAEAE